MYMYMYMHSLLKTRLKTARCSVNHVPKLQTLPRLVQTFSHAFCAPIYVSESAGIL